MPNSQGTIMAPRVPLPPRSAFEDFIEQWIMPRPNEFPHDSNEMLAQISKEAWQNPALMGHRNHFVERYNNNVAQYEAELDRYRLEMDQYEIEMARERERAHYETFETTGEEMEVETALPPPPPQREGGGGFTSING